MRWFPEPTFQSADTMASLEPFRRAGLAPWAGPGLLVGWLFRYLEVAAKAQQRWCMRSAGGEQGVRWNGEIWDGMPATGWLSWVGKPEPEGWESSSAYEGCTFPDHCQALVSGEHCQTPMEGVIRRKWGLHWFGSGRAQFTDVSSERFCTYLVTSNWRPWTKCLCAPQNQNLRKRVSEDGWFVTLVLWHISSGTFHVCLLSLWDSYVQIPINFRPWRNLHIGRCDSNK